MARPRWGGHRTLGRLVALVAALAIVIPLGHIRPAVVSAADLVVSNSGDSGPDTLRQAILDANDTPEADTIGFGTAMTISPTSPLPAIVGAVTIDGTSVATASGPGVVINGGEAGSDASGLTVGNASGTTTIRAVGIVSFAGSGILLSGTSGAVIEDNLISGNGQAGIAVIDASAGNQILENRIADNGGLGIDLGGDGVTENDGGDIDSGPNGLQNFPIVTTATADGTTVGGTLDSADDGSYTVEVFQNATCDGSGHGEGETFVGAATVSPDGTWGIDAGPINGTLLSAVATDTTTGDTSEFGPCFLVTDGLPAFGTWTGEKTQAGGGTIPGDGDLVAAGTGAPSGPAQFTYGALDPEPDGGASSPSGEWLFYTTAAANGTISVPWRWNGFHGFAGVNVQLEAIVVRGLDDEVSTQILVNPPTQSCDPCVEPSGGFDYDGTVDFPVQADDIYGFRITSSNGDTNASLYGQLTLGNNAVPQDCSDAKEIYGSTVNGRYFIQPQGGQEFSVHCTAMNTPAPKDYLSFTPEIVAAGDNFASYAAGGAAPGTTVTTTFTKIRLDPATLKVDIGDTTFSTSTGSLTHPDAGGNVTATRMSYGTAMACNPSGTDGTANINLRGTPFAIGDTWVPNGTTPTGTFAFGFDVLPPEVFVTNEQVGNITGNGFCGWNSARKGFFFAFNPSPGIFSLQLRYLSEATSPPTPVLFRASPNATNTGTGAVGRLNVAPGGYTIKLYASTSCDDGVLGDDAVALGTAPITIGADDATYFSQLVSHAASTRRYVAVSAIDDASESELSNCIVAQADNDVWPRAAELTAGAAASQASGWVDHAGGARWYKFRIDPGAQVAINLSNLPADYDVFLFKDIQQAYDEHVGLSDTSELTRLSAEFAATNIAPQGYAPQGYAPQGYAPQAYAPDAFAPDEYAPQAYAPQGYAPQAYAPQGYAPQAYAPQGYAPQGYAPQAYAPDGYAPQAYAPTIFLPQAYASAQVTTLFALSAQTGTGPETIVANSWNNTGHFYIRVSGKNGSFSADAPFQLSVAMQSQICAGIQLDGNAPMSVTGAPSTLILTYPSQMKSTTLGNGPEDKSALAQGLAAFARRVNGADVGVIDVGLDPGVAAMTAQAELKPACPFAKNLVANEIKDIVDKYRGSNPGILKYVVLVGDDSAIPFFRYPDQALLGPEQDFVPPVDRLSSSEASLRSNYVLGQDEYGASVVLSHGVSTLPVPDLPVGRLVETAADINIALAGFMALADGVVPTPTTSLVTGYDFIADASDAIATDLGEGMGTGGTPDTLITPFDVSPLDARSWTASQLKSKLQAEPDLLFLGGHFSADSALAADFSTTITTADLEDVDLVNSIVFSIGCHAGYNTVDAHGIRDVTNTLDWAQVMARKQATFIAGTGYQYGDTDFIEYSERIYVEFARELRRGTGVIAVGDALVRSKQSYLRTTNDLRGLHEKALLESALYGFPMVAVDLPSRLSTPATTSIVPDTIEYETDPGAALGLELRDVTIDATLTPHDDELDIVGTDDTVATRYYSGSSGVVTHQNEPAIPLEARNVTSPDAVPRSVLRGVLWTGGAYTDETLVPLTGAPATESRGVHTRFGSPVFYPIRPWSLNYTDALTQGNGGTHLLVTPAQHKGSLSSDQATLRKYSSMDFRLLYSTFTGPLALSGAPEISGITASAIGDQVSFQVRVSGDVGVGVQVVSILYTTGPNSSGQGSWIPLELAQDPDDTTLWTATETIAAGSSVKYLVQAVNGLGLVTMNENYGEYFTVTTGNVQPADPIPTTLAVSGPSTGVHAGTATFTATLKEGSTGLPGKSVVVSAGGISRVGQTNGSGIATVELPLLVLPGTYDVSATFPGDAQHAGSSATRAIGVTKAPTTLTLEATDLVPKPDGPVTFVATLKSGNTRLAQRTLAFLVTRSTGAVTLKTFTTDLLGEVDLQLPSGMNAIRQIEVRFGSLVAVSAGPTVDLTDAWYLPSTAATWPFTGFVAPVDNRPIVNAVKAGTAVPVRFSVGGDRGLGIFRSGYPKVVLISCQSGAQIDDIESTVTANASGLQYASGNDQYTYVWKTPKATGCYRLDLWFTDGTIQSALFRLK